MNPFIKKEILLMLPAWLAVLVLEGSLPWLFRDFEGAFQLLPLFFFLGVIIPAVSSFGREFNAGSFQLLMSQPIERGRIWRTKLTVLICALASIFLVYLASCWLRRTEFPSEFSLFAYRLGFTDHEFLRTMSASGIGALIALASGLWTTLLFRQVATAFWITLLVPAGLLTLIGFFLPLSASSTTFLVVFEIVAGVYVVAAFWLAHRLFFRAQDVGWTGGNVSLSRWRYFEARSQSPDIIRVHRPILALAQKEFQLHSATLFGAVIMLGLQILVFFLRGYYLCHHKNTGVIDLTNFFWLLWLVFPLIIGCTVIAEERRIGVLEQQLCLPISRRWQFAIKFFTTLIFGVFLGSGMPILLETMAAHLGVPNEMFSETIQPLWNLGVPVCLLVVSVGFSLAALFGSSLSKNFLPALTLAILTIICCPGLVPLINLLIKPFPIFGYASIVPGPLFVLMAIPAIPITLLWLTWLNFNYLQDGRRILWGSLSFILGMIVIIGLLSNAIYYRSWELLTPFKSPSGPVRLTSQTPVKLSVWGNTISAILPDGRLWAEDIKYGPGFVSVLPGFSKLSISRQSHFVGGSNWVETAASSYLTVGIKSDGTLWSGRNWDSSQLVEVGTEKDWRQVVSGGNDLLFLKTDGSLWGSGFPIQDYRLNTAVPERIGNESNWVNIFSQRDAYAEKSDGSIWEWQVTLGNNSVHTQLVQATNSLPPGCIFAGSWSIAVDTNGELWYLSEPLDNWSWSVGGIPKYSKKTQFGREAKWKSASIDIWQKSMITLRADGTLWQWPFPWRTDLAKVRPKQIGNYSDWIALSYYYDGVALAADGSLWAWGEQSDYSWLAPSRQPVFLGNIFSTNSINQ